MNLNRILLALTLLLTSCTKTYFSPLQDNIDRRALVERTLAEPSIKGYDFLGLAKQDCGFIASTIDPKTALGVLLGTFGDTRPCMSSILNTGKIVAVRFHAIDGTVNNHSCSGNVVSLSFLQKKLEIMKAFAAGYPNVKWYGSPVLEQGCRDKNIVNGWFALMKKVWPELIPVCSSNGQGYCPAGVLKEIHGGGVGDITSPDGVSGFDMRVQYLLQGARVIAFNWAPCCNGRVSGEHPGDSVPPPMNRVNWCTHNEIRQLVFMMRNPEPFPNVNSCNQIASPELLKSNAEYYGQRHDDGRGNKPLLILNKKYGRISLQTLKGMEVAFMTYYGLFGKQFRHYEGGRYGSNFTPDQLFDKFGGEWGLAKAQGKCYLYNSIRRQGYFR